MTLHNIIERAALVGQGHVLAQKIKSFLCIRHVQPHCCIRHITTLTYYHQYDSSLIDRQKSDEVYFLLIGGRRQCKTCKMRDL